MNNKETENGFKGAVSGSFGLTSFINNKQMFTTIRQHDVSGVRCEKQEDGIVFSKIGTDEKIKIPYQHCKDFTMAVLESLCDFTMCGEIDIKVEVKCK